MELSNKWAKRFLVLAREISDWSKDDSTKVGCVIIDRNRNIVATGYNGIPRGVSDDEPHRRERPEKYYWTEHAERNAIYSAARRGVSLEGCALVQMWYPCADCARAIIQSGITLVVCDREPDYECPRWGQNFQASTQMFAEAGVRVVIAE